MTDQIINKSDLVHELANAFAQYSEKEVEEAAKLIIETMALTLIANKRIEIRGFGSFVVNERAPRLGRNPKTGDTVQVDSKFIPHFKPGKELRELVNKSFKG
jgi:integration host factor subunit beta